MNDASGTAAPRAADAPDSDACSSLEGLRVVDFSDGVAGQFAARILSDYGAQVTLIERPEGSSTRRLPPLDPNSPADEQSLLFLHLNVGKQTARLEPSQEAISVQMEACAFGADVVVVEDPTLAAEMSAVDPRRVVCCLTEFTPGGPYAQWKGCELVHQALGGLMYMTGRAGEEPLYGFGHRAYYSAGAAAAVAIMAALVERQTSGLGQRVAVSVHEAAAAMSQHLVGQYSYNGTYPRRGVYPTGGVDTFRCNDGWIVMYCRSDRWTALCNELGAPSLGADPAFAPANYARNWPEAHRRISPYFAQCSVVEVLRVSEAARCVAAKVMTMADVLACEHLKARGYWSFGTKAGRNRAALGPLFRIQSVHPRAKLTSSCAETTCAERSPPLAGVRVAELTTAWAGPMLGRILAELGADVIKIESPDAMDVFRGAPKGGDRTQYPEGVAGDEPFNRAVAFNSQNIGKRSIGLDLKSAAVRPQVEHLIRSCDVVICNLAPRSLRSLGFDDAALRKIRSDIIRVEMPAAGGGGPLSDITGVGHTMEALAGMTSLQGYDDGAPQRTGPAYLDPIGALNGAIAVLIALYTRRRTGAGCQIELAQREAAMHWLGEWLLAQERGIAPPVPRGNARIHAAPHGAYRTRGDDEWIAIGAFSDADWQAICAILEPTLAADQRFRTLAGRERHADSLRETVERHTRQHDKHDLAARLQAHNVRAAPVCSGQDLHDDRQLQEVGFFVELDHPAAGRRRYHGLPFRLSAHTSPSLRPAPLLGQHTEILSGSE